MAVRLSGFARAGSNNESAPRDAKIAMTFSHWPLSHSEGGGVPDEGGVGAV